MDSLKILLIRRNGIAYDFLSQEIEELAGENLIAVFSKKTKAQIKKQTLKSKLIDQLRSLKYKYLDKNEYYLTDWKYEQHKNAFATAIKAKAQKVFKSKLDKTVASKSHFFSKQEELSKFLENNPTDILITDYSSIVEDQTISNKVKTILRFSEGELTNPNKALNPIRGLYHRDLNRICSKVLQKESNEYKQLECMLTITEEDSLEDISLRNFRNEVKMIKQLISNPAYKRLEPLSRGNGIEEVTKEIFKQVQQQIKTGWLKFEIRRMQNF